MFNTKPIKREKGYFSRTKDGKKQYANSVLGSTGEIMWEDEVDFGTKSVKEIKWENRIRRFKRITASLSQLLNLFPRIDAPSSVLVVIGLSLSGSMFV